MLDSVPEPEVIKSIQQSTLKMLNQKINLGIWQIYGETYTYGNMRTDFYYELELRRPYLFEEFDYSIFDLKQIENIKIHDVMYLFEAEGYQAEQITQKVLKHICAKHKNMELCVLGNMSGGKDLYFGIKCIPNP